MIVFAVNIHTGGGKILLDELIASERFGEITHLFLDSRYQNTSIPPRIQIKHYTPTIRMRLRAQNDLRKMINTRPENFKDKTALFFGNLPPFYKLDCTAIVYLQNCFLLSGVPLPKDSIKVAFRNFVERHLLKFFSSNYQQIWVQSEWMTNLTKKNFPKKEVFLKPFLPTLPPIFEVEKSNDLISVTSLSKHKNFDFLIHAFVLLDLKLNKSINVVLVLDNLVNVSNIVVPRFKNVHLTLKAQLSREELYLEYQKSKTAVITSAFESYCLPLHEALHFKLPVICPKAAYTADVKDQTLQFDLKSVDSLVKLLEKII